MSNHRWKTCLRIISCNPTPKRWHLRCRRSPWIPSVGNSNCICTFFVTYLQTGIMWRNNLKLPFDLKLKEKSDFFHYVHQLHTKSISSQRNSDVRNSSHYWVCPLEICHSAVVELSPWLKAIEQRSLACLKVCWSFFSNRFLYWGY